MESKWEASGPPEKDGEERNEFLDAWKGELV